MTHEQKEGTGFKECSGKEAVLRENVYTCMGRKKRCSSDNYFYDTHLFPPLPADMGNGIQFGGAIGYIVLPGVAYLVRDFRLIQLVIAGPEVMFLLGWFLLPESPRWLLINGRVSEAEEVMRTAAEANKLPVNHIKQQITHLFNQLKHVSVMFLQIRFL